jgi:transposase
VAYREVDVLWIREVLRRWQCGAKKKAIARELGMSPKTVRRYVAWATETCPPPVSDAPRAVVDAWLDSAEQAALGQRETGRHRPQGDPWQWCERNRERIAALLAKRHYDRPLTLRTVHRRLGKPVSYSTLYRFAVAELDFSRPEPTVPVADCEAGEEVQIDTGWVASLAMDALGVRRRVRAWIFTAVLSRHRFVWPIARETTVESIAACEAAWQFFGGMFRYVIPDNTKAIVELADPVDPKIVRTFLEYSQARGFVVTPARARRPKDKARVERAVPTVRDDCFGGEAPRDVAHAREIAERWCRDEYGMRLHSTTRRRPREHFDAEERSALRPYPETPYDVPTWHRPIVQSQYVRVLGALYSVSPEVRGQVDARADRTLVRVYVDRQVVATHPRKGPGERSTDPNHFDASKLAAASRDRAFFVAEARAYGDNVGAYAEALLGSGQYFARLRCVQRLLDHVRRYGAARVDETCRTALAAEMVDVTRLGRMLEQAVTDTGSSPQARVIKLGRFLRPASAFRLGAGDVS